VPTYESQVHHNGLKPGDTIVLDRLQIEEWAGEIAAGFLVRVDVPAGPIGDDDAWPDPLAGTAETVDAVVE